MSEPIDPTKFPQVSFEDTISLTITAAAASDLVEFVLETPERITWWKGLELRSDQGDLLSQIETKDNNRRPGQLQVRRALPAQRL